MESVLLVSHYYHISRAKLAFARFGVKSVYAVHAEASFDLRDVGSIVREFFAYYFYLARSYS
jgi:uncharacterized SAM-binding protein YcdF (DUF218 family)